MLKRQRYLVPFIGFLLVAATLTVYGQLYDHEFLSYDDDDYITENRAVRSGWTKSGFIWAFTTIHHAH